MAELNRVDLMLQTREALEALSRHDAGTLDIDAVRTALVEYLDESDERIDQLRLLDE